jgi:hypothetical protein
VKCASVSKDSADAFYMAARYCGFSNDQIKLNEIRRGHNLLHRKSQSGNIGEYPVKAKTTDLDKIVKTVDEIREKYDQALSKEKKDTPTLKVRVPDPNEQEVELTATTPRPHQ